MGKGLLGRKAGATQREWSGAGRGGRCGGGGAGGLRHRLLGAVHEAAVQLCELPVGDVTGALLQVLETEQGRRSGPTRAGGGCAPHPPADGPQALTVSRSRRKRMLGTR